MTEGAASATIPAAVRAGFPALGDDATAERLSGGLLHRSLRVRSGGRDYVLQRVSPVFAPEIHANIQAVTRHLQRSGLRAAELLPTSEGRPFLELGEGGRWRLMPDLGGVPFARVQSLAQARSAGELVGRFHRALADFAAPLAPMGIPYRDTPRYVAELREALATAGGGALATDVRDLGARVLDALDALGPPPAVRTRVIHGDLKLDNVLFEAASGPGRDRALALIDFDTLMTAALWVELGDAWRSWCNPAGEDTVDTRFDDDVFAHSLEGFLAGHAAPLAPGEADSLATAPERLALELCARFAADALLDRYFGWDPERFESRAAHNAVRARGQWQVYRAARATRGERVARLAGA